MRHRHELTGEQWERLAPLLPPPRVRIGRPAEDHRRIVIGMLGRRPRRAIRAYNRAGANTREWTEVAWRSGIRAT